MRGPKKYAYNEDFFKQIDTPEKAYILGFWYADGSVYVSKWRQYRATITLSIVDLEILEKMRDRLAPNMKIKEYQPKTAYNSGRAGILCLTSKAITEDIIKLGCIPRKSFTLQFPTSKQVPDHLMSHFLRGYFDGDGSLSFRARETKCPKACVSIDSSKFFCEGLKAFLKQKLNMGCTLNQRWKDTPSKSLRLNGNRQILQFMDYIMKDHGNMRLKRKASKYEDFKRAYSTFFST